VENFTISQNGTTYQVTTMPTSSYWTVVEEVGIIVAAAVVSYFTAGLLAAPASMFAASIGIGAVEPNWVGNVPKWVLTTLGAAGGFLLGAATLRELEFVVTCSSGSEPDDAKCLRRRAAGGGAPCPGMETRGKPG
jgi:hypothetical protein